MTKAADGDRQVGIAAASDQFNRFGPGRLVGVLRAGQRQPVASGEQLHDIARAISQSHGIGQRKRLDDQVFLGRAGARRRSCHCEIVRGGNPHGPDIAARRGEDDPSIADDLKDRGWSLLLAPRIIGSLHVHGTPPQPKDRPEHSGPRSPSSAPGLVLAPSGNRVLCRGAKPRATIYALF